MRSKSPQPEGHEHLQQQHESLVLSLQQLDGDEASGAPTTPVATGQAIDLNSGNSGNQNDTFRDVHRRIPLKRPLAPGDGRGDPESKSPRKIAEFEQMSGVLIAYPLGVPASLVADFTTHAIVYCLCSSSQQRGCNSLPRNDYFSTTFG